MEPLDLAEYDIPESTEFQHENAALPSENPDFSFNDIGVAEEIAMDRAAGGTSTRRSTKYKVGASLAEHKGLPLLLERVKKIKFKGHGHERRDLVKLLNTYRLWGHCFNPKANFDDFLALCRQAGKDPAVRAYRQRLRDEEKYDRTLKEYRLQHTAAENKDALPNIDAPGDPRTTDECSSKRLKEVVNFAGHTSTDALQEENAILREYEELGF